MIVTLDNGAVLDVDMELRTGFKVYDQDGTASQFLHINPRIVRIIKGPTTPPGGGEPIPELRAA